MNLKKIKDFLRRHQHFLIAVHSSPEGDCLGAELALVRFLKRLKKKYAMINHDQPTHEYDFLPGIKQIQTQLQKKPFDAAIVLDCSDLGRTGKVTALIPQRMPILNIDHHISNRFFGSINVVDAKASSTCEVLYCLFKELGVALDQHMALCLYTGIVVDTGSFRYSNTTAHTHEVVAQLLQFGIDVPFVYRSLYEKFSFSDIGLIQEALSNVKIDATGTLAWTIVTQAMIRRHKPTIDLADAILNLVRSIKQVEVCLLFKEQSAEVHCVRVNLRSRGRVNVNAIAQHFGGGGHVTASGATFKKTNIETAQKLVIGYIKKKM